MSTKQRGLVQVVEAPPAERQPLGSDISVVFRGDGEPRSTEAVLKHLAEFDADVGFEADSFSLGGTVERLEHRFAEMLGKEASAFMPTGTLANHLAIRRHCGESPRAVVQEQSHLYNDTGDSLAQLSSINLVPLAKGRPYFNLEELEEIVGRSDTGRVANPVGVVMIESPVRRQAGRIVPYEEMVAITDYCRERGIATHLDGARLFMMSAATGISPHKYADLFDTVYVSLYKYFVAPFGAILAGPDAFINDLYHDRRMFGGGLVVQHVCIEGYSDLSLMRASSVVKRQFTRTASRLRLFCHASTSPRRVSLSGMRRSRHCRASTPISISAIFSQLPCLGV